MPKNRLIRLGVVIVAATAIVWLTKTLLARVEMEALGFAFGIGALLIVAGLFVEMRKGAQAPQEGDRDGNG